jgi:hypothetical protein
MQHIFGDMSHRNCRPIHTNGESRLFYCRSCPLLARATYTVLVDKSGLYSLRYIVCPTVCGLQLAVCLLWRWNRHPQHPMELFHEQSISVTATGDFKLVLSQVLLRPKFIIIHPVCRSFATQFSSALTKDLATEAPELSPNPLSTALPFGRDPDYVQQGSLLKELRLKLSRSGRAALVGMGGIGYVPGVAFVA